MIRRTGRLGRWGAVAGLALATGGCSSIGSLTGAVTGAAAGGGSVNPAVGYAVGIGSKAAVDSLVKYLSRKRQAYAQNVLARTAGSLAVGESAPWKVHHSVPLFDDAHGRLTVVRDIPNVLAPCREVLFTVLSGKADQKAASYDTQVCKGSVGWRWALAEPATPRWGALQ